VRQPALCLVVFNVHHLHLHALAILAAQLVAQLLAEALRRASLCACSVFMRRCRQAAKREQRGHGVRGEGRAHAHQHCRCLRSRGRSGRRMRRMHGPWAQALALPHDAVWLCAGLRASLPAPALHEPRTRALTCVPYSTRTLGLPGVLGTSAATTVFGGFEGFTPLLRRLRYTYSTVRASSSSEHRAAGDGDGSAPAASIAPATAAQAVVGCLIHTAY
jgi:hypothetical protein